MIKIAKIWKISLGLCFWAAFFVFLALGEKAEAATLSLSPSSGTFEVGSTFDVSIMLNTEGQSVNAVKASLSFPADSLQIASPSAGQSIVGIWASPPSFSNSAGTISLEGGFPDGSNVTNGLITKITFRVKSTGTAIVKFKDDSKVLLDDGKGTGALSQTNNGIYTLTLPPPAGPEVVSETHPDQSRWYNNTSAVLRWADIDPSLAEKYSYTLSDDPTEIPDDVSEGDKNSVVYKNLSDNRHYFHIKALNENGVWGGTTHYALNIDSTPPADFSLDIFPSKSTVRRNPVIQFSTTDILSGIDHYELKIVSLNNENYIVADMQESQKMFIEAGSPYLSPNLEIGNYDVIVRAYDAVGNYRESTQRLKIANIIFQFISNEGLVFHNYTIVPWPWFFLVGLLFIGALIFVIWKLRHLHRNVDQAKEKKHLPPDVQKKMEELKRLKEKYKNFVAIALLFLGSFFLLAGSVQAEDAFLEIEPPLITTISKNISNDEIFYVGGKAEINGEKVTIYIKNNETGETFNEEVTTDNKGEWFYRHDGFLSGGDYILWAQSKIEKQISPPSPQVKMTVNKTALQFGSSRISFELLLSLIIALLLLILSAMIFYIVLSTKRLRGKNASFKKEISEVESAVHKGFMILHREINKELKLTEESDSKKTLSKNESEYREHLMDDLKKIESHIEKEISDVEKIFNN
jgi:hypothetical protein